MKILWLTPPSTSIYSPLYNELSKLDKKLNLLMVLPDQVKGRDLGNKFFKIRFLSTKEWGKVIFFPLFMHSAIVKRNLNDFPSNVTFKDFSALAEEEKPDMIIVNEIYNLYTLQAAKYCKKAGIPLIIQTELQRYGSSASEFLMRRYFSAFEKQLLKQPALIQCWTESSIDFMKKQFPKYASKMKVMAGGIDTKMFYPRKKSSEKVFRILMAARMVPFKRHIDLLKAAVVLKEKKFNFKITFLGEGPIKEQVANEVKKLGLEKNIEFAPKVPYEKIPAFYSKFDCLVLPSYNEAIGMVVPEAMACGLPAIVSDTVAARMYLRENIDGLVFKTYDTTELTDKIVLMSKKHKEFSKKSAENIKKNHSLERAAKEFLKQIKAVK